jgi:hypothetical protein
VGGFRRLPTSSRRDGSSNEVSSTIHSTLYLSECCLSLQSVPRTIRIFSLQYLLHYFSMHNLHIIFGIVIRLRTGRPRNRGAISSKGMSLQPSG